MTKNIYVEEFVFLQKAPIRPVWKMCPIPYLPLIVEYINIFSNKTFVCSYSKKNSHYWILFMVNIWNHGKNLQDLRGQNHYKNAGLVYHLAIYHDFHGQKQSHFFHLRDCYLRKKIM